MKIVATIATGYREAGFSGARSLKVGRPVLRRKLRRGKIVNGNIISGGVASIYRSRTIRASCSMR